jgi:membrane protein DedA with SNARE-associated domain
MKAMLMEMVSWLVETIGYMGYTGIVVLMTVESSLFPFPSEVVIPPAGFLAATGRMDLTLVILAGIAGSLLGAFFNYWMALKLGRPFFERYGKYVFVSHEALERADLYFAKHGHISTFVGRLIPGIRQLISLPAGVARMPLGIFTFFTALGAGIWVVVLALLGYFLGDNKALIHQHLHTITYATLGFCLLLGVGYWRWQRRKALKARD